jgi:DNA polymerase-3 subunit alpha (Gram-positive type)
MKEKLRVLFESLSFDLEIAEKHIISAVHEREPNIFKLQIESDELLAADCINKAAELIKNELGISGVVIYPKYLAGLFSAEYIPEIIGLMKHIPVIAGGLLNDIEINDDGEVFELTLSGGGREILLAESLDKEIEKLAKWFFGVNIKIEINNSPVPEKPQEPEEAVPVFVSAKPPAPKEADKPKFNNGFNGGGGRRKNIEVLESFKEFELPFEHEMFSKEAKLVFGKNITQAPVNMLDLGLEAENVVLWGEVFDYEEKLVKQGRSAIILVGFTDYTSSQTLKIFTSAEKASGFKAIKGSAILISGDLKHDDFVKEPVIEPKSIMLIKPHKRADRAPEKRCELHMHTNMSDKDATNSAKELINLAYNWGHRAVAITDHGNLQAYPEAMDAYDDIKKSAPDADFKLIYGVEAYFVRDGKALVEDCGDYPLNSELIIFDVETTGLSPTAERITEIGAVKLVNLEVVSEFCTFVNPEKPIPDHITQRTGINDDMVKDAPQEAAALAKFIKFCGGNPVLIAHNASFDNGFIRESCKRSRISFEFNTVDTLKLCRAAVPGNKAHTLEAMAKYYKLGEFNHHRALDDAKTLAKIFTKLTADTNRGGSLKKLGDFNTLLGSVDFKKEESYHMVILVQNQAGLKNLYKLVSLSNLNYFYKKPRIPLSELKKHREGLLLGSACESGELYRAVLEGMSEERLIEIAELYDYLEVQPTANNEFLVRDGRVDSELKLQIFNRNIVGLGKKLNKPVVAACDVHFKNERDSIFREILMVGQGYKDASNQAPLYFRTTEEMLAEFASYLGDDVAHEIVISNPNKIADMIEHVCPIPGTMHAPVVEGAEEEARRFAYERARELYGEVLPEIVEKQLEKELTPIIANGFAGLYTTARELIKRSEECGYLVASRGSVGSSFVATMLGVSEVNPLFPHYRCPKCKYSRFIEDGSVQSGFDLPPENCHKCNTAMLGDGHDIPFESFMGFRGEKIPDIDLNFSGEYQMEAHKHTEKKFGKDYVFKSGTVSAIQDKTAFGYVKKYLDERKITVSKAELNRLVKGCTGVKVTTGQHPGGMIVVPREYEIYDFTPIQHPGTQKDKSIITTHFDYGALEKTLLKLDLLGHDVPTLYKLLEDMTGIKIADVPTSDREVMSLFLSTKALKLDVDYDPNLIPLGVYGLPEFGTENTIRVTKEAKPKLFSDLVQISGLTHGEGIWQGNAQELIKSGKCTISTVIGTRDNIMVYLMHKGMEASMAFRITEITRRGGAQKFFDDEIYKAFEECNIEEWYIESCKKIKYMFPKAHAAAYVTGAVKFGWFKINYPAEFYAAVLTKHTENLDIDCVLAGKEAVKRRIQAISANQEAEAKEKAILKALYIVYEMLCRGIKFLPVRYNKSDAARYVIENNNLRLPFLAIENCGENAAKRMKEVVESGDFISIDDIKMKAGINNTVMERLNEMDAFEGLPQSAQLSLFEVL